MALHQEVDARLVVAAALRILIVSVSAAAIGVTIAAFYFFPIRPDLGGLPGLTFWTVVTLLASALPVRFPRGNLVSVNTAPILASMVLGGPAAAGLVTWIGTTEWRELRGRIPWYGTLYNHAAIAGPAILAALLYEALIVSLGTSALVALVATSVAGLLFFALNSVAVSTLIAIRRGGSVQASIRTNIGEISTKLVALAPLSWLMAFVYLRVGWWATLLFALPLYTTREAYHRFVEMREMFTSTVRALASAVDARDTWTSGHSTKVQEIAVVIAKEMRVSAALLEAIEWGGLLHDVGKIGVRDAILLKEDRLTREERIEMNAHPEIGARIAGEVKQLGPEVPIIRHHHEWFNGSGYPDRLEGESIPLGARILHVADAFEAMTSPRPYRPKPLTPDAALREIRKFTGVQFDPRVVEAFVRTPYAVGLADPGRPPQPTPIPILAPAAVTAQAVGTGRDNAGVDAS
jgi:putative nucleotidyltransferase with HDIG domain